jgi:hypothetical protein
MRASRIFLSAILLGAATPALGADLPAEGPIDSNFRWTSRNTGTIPAAGGNNRVTPDAMLVVTGAAPSSVLDRLGAHCIGAGERTPRRSPMSSPVGASSRMPMATRSLRSGKSRWPRPRVGIHPRHGPRSRAVRKASISVSLKLSGQPAHYAELEGALVLFAPLAEPAELRRVLAGIAHPAAANAGELLAHGRPVGAEAVLEDALEAMARPDSGAALGWFSPQAHRQERR